MTMILMTMMTVKDGEDDGEDDNDNDVNNNDDIINRQ